MCRRRPGWSGSGASWTSTAEPHFHEVDDVDHWLRSPKREQTFGPMGLTARTFVDESYPSEHSAHATRLLSLRASAAGTIFRASASGVVVISFAAPNRRSLCASALLLANSPSQRGAGPHRVPPL